MADFKVIEVWGKKVERGKAFTVSGKKLKAVLAQLKKRKEWGEFVFKCKPIGTEPGRLAEVRLSLSYEIRLPVWKDLNSATDGAQEEWKRMLKALIKHEEEHKKIFLKDVKTFKKGILDAAAGKQGITKARLVKLQADWMKATEARQKKFDASTKNGAGKHVTLDPDKDSTKVKIPNLF